MYHKRGTSILLSGGGDMNNLDTDIMYPQSLSLEDMEWFDFFGAAPKPWFGAMRRRHKLMRRLAKRIKNNSLCALKSQRS